MRVSGNSSAYVSFYTWSGSTIKQSGLQAAIKGSALSDCGVYDCILRAKFLVDNDTNIPKVRNAFERRVRRTHSRRGYRFESAVLSVVVSEREGHVGE
jgi:hypothetical protein